MGKKLKDEKRRNIHYRLFSFVIGNCVFFRSYRVCRKMSVKIVIKSLLKVVKKKETHKNEHRWRDNWKEHRSKNKNKKCWEKGKMLECWTFNHWQWDHHHIHYHLQSVRKENNTMKKMQFAHSIIQNIYKSKKSTIKFLKIRKKGWSSSEQGTL